MRKLESREAKSPASGRTAEQWNGNSGLRGSKVHILLVRPGGEPLLGHQQNNQFLQCFFIIRNWSDIIESSNINGRELLFSHVNEVRRIVAPWCSQRFRLSLAVVLPSLKCGLHPNAVKVTAGVPAITPSIHTRRKGESTDEKISDSSDCFLYRGSFSGRYTQQQHLLTNF